ncbi:hypothetical protein IFM89_000051 [Coptis chinensis]|uniref:Ionotropic glutamate receptor C-terminal domain-containing protein n=1 Tax=Coptis chinensis TaxID=261450 RepID=A0A835IQE1_9MAGN|nr:hypothetical protein IFM89_000051 [Coptis chinensis]
MNVWVSWCGLEASNNDQVAPYGFSLLSMFSYHVEWMCKGQHSPGSSIGLLSNYVLPHVVPFKFVPYGDGHQNPNNNELVNLITFDVVLGDIAIVTNHTRIVELTQSYNDYGLLVVVLLKRLNSDGWFSFSTLIFSHRQSTVITLGHFVLLIWIFVVLIINSSYTASLTSILTVQPYRVYIYLFQSHAGVAREYKWDIPIPWKVDSDLSLISEVKEKGECRAGIGRHKSVTKGFLRSLVIMQATQDFLFHGPRRGKTDLRSYLKRKLKLSPVEEDIGEEDNKEEQKHSNEDESQQAPTKRVTNGNISTEPTIDLNFMADVWQLDTMEVEPDNVQIKTLDSQPEVEKLKDCNQLSVREERAAEVCLDKLLEVMSVGLPLIKQNPTVLARHSLPPNPAQSTKSKVLTQVYWWLYDQTLKTGHAADLTI